jgi:TonB family protein
MKSPRLVPAQKSLIALAVILCAIPTLAGAVRRDNPRQHVRVGDYLFRSGDIAKAVFEYEHALRLEPGLKRTLRTRIAAGHYVLCERLARKKDLSGAFYELKKALGLMPEEGYWHLALAFLQVKAGDLPSARAECEKAAQLEPNDPGLGVTCKELGTPITYFDNAEGPSEVAQIFTDLQRTKSEIRDPILVHTPRVGYPRKASAIGYRGTVAMIVAVGTDGQVGIERVIKPMGLGLDREALRVVRKMRFKPATRRGTPVPTTVLVEVSFE